MFISILTFVFIGVFLGVLTGLIPGIHPNLLVLIIPLLMALNLNSYELLAMIVAMAVTNSITDFIPSILLGAPDSGNELSTLPGHRLLMNGHGYYAIKLTVIGGIFSTIFVTIFLPLVIFTVPKIYSFIRPIIHILLILIVVYLISRESGFRKIVSASCFLLAGIIGLLSNALPINNNLILFPILSGLFGLPLLVLQIKEKNDIPHQLEESVVKIRFKSAFLGSIAGLIAGFLPGIGPSQMATLTSVENDEDFLTSIGAITTSNIILSFLTIWLIGRARSGVAMAVESFMEISFTSILLIIIVSLISMGLASVLTLKLTTLFLRFIQMFDYNKISLLVLIMLNVLIMAFTGPVGIFLAWLCCALGLFANLLGIRRTHLMGVLILPTILFYIGIS